MVGTTHHERFLDLRLGENKSYIVTNSTVVYSRVWLCAWRIKETGRVPGIGRQEFSSEHLTDIFWFCFFEWCCTSLNWTNWKEDKKKNLKKEKSSSDDPCTIPTRLKYILLEKREAKWIRYIPARLSLYFYSRLVCLIYIYIFLFFSRPKRRCVMSWNKRDTRKEPASFEIMK